MGLQKIVRGVASHKKKSFVNFQHRKTYMSEVIAILRKRKLWSSVKWTDAQQKEFDDYWRANYGRKIPNWWHRLYQCSSGVYNVRYIPEMLYSTKIEPAWNPYFQSYELENKGLLELIVASKLGNARCPITYAIADEGIYYDEKRNVITLEKLIEQISNIGKCVIKPTKDTSSGHNVRILNVRDGVDQKSKERIINIISTYGDDYIVQEKIEPADSLAVIYAGAINTFRITTYIFNRMIYHTPVALRIGSSGGEVDNIHAGGMGIYVDDDGTLADTAYILGYGDRDERFTQHPDTGFVFAGYKIPEFARIISTAERLHGCFPGVRIISWDLTVDKDEKVVLIEANVGHGQGVWFPQIVSGQGVFGKQTELVLHEFKENY